MAVLPNCRTQGARVVAARDPLRRLGGGPAVSWRARARSRPGAGDPEYEGLYFCNGLIFGNDLSFVAEFVPATSTAPAWTTVGA